MIFLVLDKIYFILLIFVAWNLIQFKTSLGRLVPIILDVTFNIEHMIFERMIAP